MKKAFFLPLLALVCLPLLSACGKYDYTRHLSDVRCDLFCAETDLFSVTLSCVSREYPFLSDGVAAERSDSVEIVLTEPVPTGAEYEVYVLGDAVWGGDMSFRSASGDYRYSKGVDAFPSGSVSLRIVRNGEATELTATSVKNSRTLSVEEILSKAIDAEGETVKRMQAGGVFHGEFHVRLLRRDKNYYYVGIVNEHGETISLLLDSETGTVLARREPR